jgi:tetratricopeptide (TPR) repeat protein
MRLLAADSDSLRLRFQVSFTLIALGDVLTNLRDLASARARFEEAHAVSTRFGDEGAAIDALRKVRDVAQAQGDSTYARRVQEQVGSGQHGPILQVHSLQNYGDLLSRQGDLTGARAAHEEALAIMRRLAAGDTAVPDHERNKQELGIALGRFAEALLSRGDFARAVAVFDELIELRRRSAAADPRDDRRQTDLAQALRYRAYPLIEQGRLADARAACGEALEISKRVAEAEQNTAYLMTPYARSLACMAEALRRQNDLQGARAQYEASRDIWMSLLRRPSGERTTHITWYLSLVLFSLSEIALEEGRREEALRELDRVRQAFELYRNNLGDEHHNLYGWAQLGAEFRLAQARGDAAGVQRAIARLRELDEAGWQPLHDTWVDELRALSRGQPQGLSDQGRRQR